MTELPEIGKISSEVFRELIFPHLGAHSSEILVGPQHGVDVGVVTIGDKAVAMTTDPVFIVPEYGFDRAAWFAIHILASDIVTSGLSPTFLSIDLNFPLSLTEEELTVIWETIDKECKKMGMAIVCGHTARYDNCNYPMVGGATVIAVGELDEYVSPRFARAGDSIIITKGPAIEASGIFAAMFPKLLSKEFGEKFAQEAQNLFYKMSVVDDAMIAKKIGIREQGVTAMHDATECGIWGGVFEIAQAAGLGARIVKEDIVIENCISEICNLFNIDPYKSISEGTLIISCKEEKAQLVVDALENMNIRASVVGELIDPKFGMLLIEEGKEKKLEHPRIDPFWNAFSQAVQSYGQFESNSKRCHTKKSH